MMNSVTKQAFKGGLIAGIILLAYMSIRSYLVFRTFRETGASAPAYLFLLPIVAFVFGFVAGALVTLYVSKRRG